MSKVFSLAEARERRKRQRTESGPSTVNPFKELSDVMRIASFAHEALKLTIHLLNDTVTASTVAQNQLTEIAAVWS
jgi:hypothetical protein